MTKRQLELLRFIKKYIADRGYAPSFYEMMVSINATSRSSVFNLLRSLEEQGYIRRLPKRARAIEVVENPSLATSLHYVPSEALAAEAERRNLVLCHRMRDEYGGISYLEIKPKLDTPSS
jgi:SOS-response transcriptional repressor LexA